MQYQRGDVILCRLPMPSTGLTQFKLRPAVIVSKDPNNQRLDDVMVAPCTSNVSRSQEPTQYLITGQEIADAGIRVPSVVRCEVIMAIPKSVVMRALGRLSNTAMAAINDSLRDALEL
ncbi:MAG: type II toxin-antitoxin system PemK/MazF family toxin [Chloroflexi bacterium]|nr:type II toxin-antitoxin system PemK/MazF family toxin [Chloroflexota bacterium]MBU1748708.1 type II toxin-antitoxin system PemK/MazF family toxin [Chloroflexota bacterium]MBU1879354.1 type II toxin-antitoxin system PemK/MazF family toxin [Chloroflexota bacterium]